MFENKVLVNLYILSLGLDFEIYIPVNEKIGNISKLINNTMFDAIDFEKNFTILNVDDGTYYKKNQLIRNTNIKNGTKLLLV